MMERTLFSVVVGGGPGLKPTGKPPNGELLLGLRSDGLIDEGDGVWRSMVWLVLGSLGLKPKAKMPRCELLPGLLGKAQ